MSPPFDLWIRNAHVATCQGPSLGLRPNTSVGVRDGRVTYLGSESDRGLLGKALSDPASSDPLNRDPSAEASSGGPWAERIIDARGRALLPGLVDCHTHLVFAGSRVDEFARRMAGEDYRAIAATGGGIGSTVRATRAASDETLFEHARRRALRLRRGGATTIEVKSGYGLTVEDELRLLRVARQLEDEGIVRVSPTFLGAHLVPEKFRDRRSEYVDLVAGPMLEQVVEEQLATSIDVYLDDGAFTRDEAARILHAGQGEGLMVRAHVGQFQDLGGAELVAELGGVSADHLEVVSDEGAAALAAAETVGVLLPGAWSTLRQTPPDVERLRRHGVRLAVGSDCNPGTSPMADLSLAAALAVRNAGLTIEEAILGMTRWAAKALGREDIGRIDVGARADLILLESDDPRTLGYALGASEPALVILDGKVVEEPASAAPTW